MKAYRLPGRPRQNAVRECGRRNKRHAPPRVTATFHPVLSTNNKNNVMSRLPMVEERHEDTLTQRNEAEYQNRYHHAYTVRNWLRTHGKCNIRRPGMSQTDVTHDYEVATGQNKRKMQCTGSRPECSQNNQQRGIYRCNAEGIEK